MWGGILENNNGGSVLSQKTQYKDVENYAALSTLHWTKKNPKMTLRLLLPDLTHLILRREGQRVASLRMSPGRKEAYWLDPILHTP